MLLASKICEVKRKGDRYDVLTSNIGESNSTAGQLDQVQLM